MTVKMRETLFLYATLQKDTKKEQNSESVSNEG